MCNAADRLASCADCGARDGGRVLNVFHVIGLANVAMIGTGIGAHMAGLGLAGAILAGWIGGTFVTFGAIGLILAIASAGRRRDRGDMLREWSDDALRDRPETPAGRARRRAA